jgi:3-dehydroquinate dehydratase-2
MTKKNSKKLNILILHGPNLNLLGNREPEIYGEYKLTDINNALHNIAKLNNVAIKILQTNHEGNLVDEIQKAQKIFDGIIINPGAYTHTSIAIRDALKCLDMPIIEVHLSNIFKREEYRKISYSLEASTGIVAGFGIFSYIHALKLLIDFIKDSK